MELESKLLDAGKLLGMLDTFDDSGAILDVSRVILHAGVEDIRQTVLTHENVREYSDALQDRVVWVLITPHFLQVIDGIHLLFVLLYVQQ